MSVTGAHRRRSRRRDWPSFERCRMVLFAPVARRAVRRDCSPVSRHAPRTGRTQAPRFINAPGESIVMQTAHRRGATASGAGFSAPPRFAVQPRPSRERAVVAPRGDLDLATIDRVEAAVDDLVAAGWTSIVLDLRGLRFMDSTGLRSMVRQANRTDVTVEFIDGAAPVARLFDLTSVRQLLTFVQPHELHL